MGAKLLIIDDDGDLCALLKQILEEEGHQVETATSGPEGIKWAERKQPALIFLDLMMEGMDGIQCLKHLRRVAQRSKVVILTGHGTLKTARRAMRLGAYDYTAKPFDLNLIRAFIREVTKHE
ncbi:MAG: response regulator [Elusimicrobia bacterium]|nr:response regulator [Elusimicrobiota bacterium]